MRKKLIIFIFLIVSCATAESLTKQDAINHFLEKRKAGYISFLSDREVSIDPHARKDGYKVLGLTHKKIIDEDMKYVRLFTEVEAIHLTKSSITDAGLKYLSGLDNLEILNLDETNITDAGLKYIKNLKSLQELNLSHTKVTDRGIQELSGMKSLRGLVVYKTKVTQKGVDELKKKRPDLYIDLHGDQS